MKFTTLAFLVATVSATRLNAEYVPGAHYDPDFMHSGTKPKTFLWEKEIQATSGSGDQKQQDAEQDNDLGFVLNVDGYKVPTNMNYDEHDKFQVQSIIDYYDNPNHPLKAPMTAAEMEHPPTKNSRNDN